MDKLYLVIPCYNEQEVIHETVSRLTAKFDMLIANNKISDDSRMVLVDDGSRDKTWEIITTLNADNKYIHGVKLSGNKGHQNALLAGLMYAKERCDVCISMDADLQDDINAVDEMLDKYYAGADIVYGVRSNRDTDTFFKRTTAQTFYGLMTALGTKTVYNHADYRLMSNRALEGLSQFREVHLFLRGIVPMVGYKTDIVEYSRGERFAGESKYPLSKMLSFALEGITSLSVKPIRLVTTMGVVIFCISLLMLVYFLVVYFMGMAVDGWTTLAISVWAIGGLQILSIGVIGEYIGKIYMETKARPRYIIEQILGE